MKVAIQSQRLVSWKQLYIKKHQQLTGKMGGKDRIITGGWGTEHTIDLEKFQKIIISVLAWLMAFVVLIATASLIYGIAQGIATPPYGIFEIDELLSLFGGVFLVLIGVELLETFKAFKADKSINVLMVFMVAMIAMARKVIIMEMNGQSDDMTLIGLSAIILSLSLGYYLIKKSSAGEK